MNLSRITAIQKVEPEEQEWFPVPGWPQNFVTKDGLLKRGKRIKRYRVGSRGYVVAKIYHDRVFRETFIHRLLTIVFIPNPENKPMVNHIDGNKLNNSLDNLEWVTAIENIRHATKNDLVTYGEKSHLSKLTNKEVVKIYKLRSKSTEFLCKKFNMSPNAIKSIKTGKTWVRVTRNLK